MAEHGAGQIKIGNLDGWRRRRHRSARDSRVGAARFCQRTRAAVERIHISRSRDEESRLLLIKEALQIVLNKIVRTPMLGQSIKDQGVKPFRLRPGTGTKKSPILPAAVNSANRSALIGKDSNHPTAAFSRSISLIRSLSGFCSLSHLLNAPADCRSMMNRAAFVLRYLSLLVRLVFQPKYNHKSPVYSSPRQTLPRCIS